MIKYEKDAQQTIPTSEIKIIGLGGAGANIIDRVIIEGIKGPEILTINADLRTLHCTNAKEKIQLGEHVTRGIGCGGDPEIGLKAAKESEEEIRAAIKGRKIVFLCVGLGGGTGSGAAPLVTRIAREEGAFIVVFAVMPFGFEGARRKVQAETALNELAAMSNALVTFDNGRMAELVLAEQGIHEAFTAANSLISDSIHAISRIALFPGIVHIGLDDLVTTLSSNRSRCLFGSGKASTKDRVLKALEQALNSPLLDKGKLLKTAESVLVHICGGSSLTMFEADLMMSELSKNLNPAAQVFFGVSIDDSMGQDFSVTIMSSLPEEKVTIPMIDEEKQLDNQPTFSSSPTISLPLEKEVSVEPVRIESQPKMEPVGIERVSPPAVKKEIVTPAEAKVESNTAPVEPAISQDVEAISREKSLGVQENRAVSEEPLIKVESKSVEKVKIDFIPEDGNALEADEPILKRPIQEPLLENAFNEKDDDDLPLLIPENEETVPVSRKLVEPQINVRPQISRKPQPDNDSETKGPRRRFAHLFRKQEPQPSNMEMNNDLVGEDLPEEEPTFSRKPNKFSNLMGESTQPEVVQEEASDLSDEAKAQKAVRLSNPVDDLPDLPQQVPFKKPSFAKTVRNKGNVFTTFKNAGTLPKKKEDSSSVTNKDHTERLHAKPIENIPSKEELLMPRSGMETKSVIGKVEPEGDFFSNSFSQSELELDGKPKGRFEGESPNVYDGEDLDIPTFLRDLN